MSSPGAVACTHCGLVAPALVTEGEASFCCRGCAAAYSLLHELGLEAYYPLRERVAPDRMAAPLDTNPDAHPFAHLDDEERQCALGNEPGRAWLGVEGLHCAACVWVLEQLPSRVEGVHEVRVDLASARLQIRWDPTRVRLSALAGQLALALERVARVLTNSVLQGEGRGRVDDRAAD